MSVQCAGAPRTLRGVHRPEVCIRSFLCRKDTPFNLRGLRPFEALELGAALSTGDARCGRLTREIFYPLNSPLGACNVRMFGLPCRPRTTPSSARTPISETSKNHTTNVTLSPGVQWWGTPLNCFTSPRLRNVAWAERLRRRGLTVSVWRR